MKNEQAPFARSLRLILDMIVCQYKADVAYLFEYREARRAFTLRACAGDRKTRTDAETVELPPEAAAWIGELKGLKEMEAPFSDECVGWFPEVVLNELNRVVIAPLRTGEKLAGVLTAGWRSVDRAEAASLDGIAALALSVTALLARSQQVESATDMALRIAALEAELADLKIADRTSGFLTEAQQSNAIADLVNRHVQRVLETTDSALLFRRQLELLQEQVRDRQLLNRAKALLQRERQMSEQEAYLHLRNTSRRERRRLREVASELLHIYGRDEATDR
ncbi:MAG: ANTAR domain-containing protein [Bryobacteraceae bacterium]|nr:ANTAR domain-containing protein [Bryobacteraceae bacterium]